MPGDRRDLAAEGGAPLVGERGGDGPAGRISGAQTEQLTGGKIQPVDHAVAVEQENRQRQPLEDRTKQLQLLGVGGPRGLPLGGDQLLVARPQNI